MVVIDCERRELPPAGTGSHAEVLKREAATQRFLFLDNVRFISMLGILSMHCVGGISGPLQMGSQGLIRGIEDVLKFGTIAFFLISGFLLGDRFETADRGEYLRRRMKKVFVPWLFWFYLQVAYFAAANMYEHGLHLSFSLATIHVLGGIILSCATSSAFWFVPNLFLAVSVLMMLRRYLFSPWLGAALFAVNLFYVVNIYAEWVPSTHTIALFGFVSYVWLGSYAAKNYERISRWVGRIPTSALVAVAVLTGLLSLAETAMLMHRHSHDPVNTLRLSNQVFSVAMVLLLSRLRRAVWPKFVDVRRQMFGVYLTQTLVLAITGSVLKRALPHLPGLNQLHGSTGLLVLWIALSPVIFFVCISISQSLAKHRKLGWLVGDLALHRAERRAALLIQERALQLRADAQRQASARGSEDSGRDFAEVTMA